MRKIKVKVEKAGIFNIEKGTSLFMLLKLVRESGCDPCCFDVIGAKLNNQVRELSFLIDRDSEVVFIDLSDEDGKRIYRRSVHFVFIKAVYELYPEKKAVIRHSISKGIYFEIEDKHEITSAEVRKIRARMNRITMAAMPFVKMDVPIEEAKRIFLETGREDKFHLIEHREKEYVSMYDLGGTKDYFYGYMVPNTGYLKMFSITKYKYGVVIIFPDRNDPGKLPSFKPQPKLFNVIREHEIDGHLIGCRSLGELNRIVKEGKLDQLIEKSEYIHNSRIRELATEILEKRHKLIFIAGPSSSGKTSTALRLAKKLGEMSVGAVTVSMDDYYLDKKDIPLDENGEKDLENLQSLDIEFFKSNISILMSGKEIMNPVFDFNAGKRNVDGVLMKIRKSDVVIVEGIHGLNPEAYRGIHEKQLFRVYVSSLTSMNIDDHNRIPTTDTRLLRRIVRDRNYRNASPEITLKMWPSVRRGEERFIFPFQENADAVFNTSLYYELAVLKPYADKMINEVKSDLAQYSEARRMSVFLSYIYPGISDNIPDDSIIREFIGGSILFKQKTD